MSYSISARGANAAAALLALAAAFDERVVVPQAIHARDRDAALSTAEAMTKQLGEPVAGREVEITLHGTLAWDRGDPGVDPDGVNITSATVGASVYYVVPLKKLGETAGA